MKEYLKISKVFLFIVSFSMLGIGQLLSQTYPPSCVVTMPHSNSYFKAGSDIPIYVYSTDIGKSDQNGTVSKLEFYAGDMLLGESTTHNNNTFTFVWEDVQEGNYTITAKATNDKGVSFTSAGVLVTVGSEDAIASGLSACKGKYLGNIISYSVNDNFDYWNGVTAENACKWGSVESTRDKFNWSGADLVYNYASDNNLMFRYHAIAWGSQYPKWLEDLSTDVTEFRAEIEEYMAAIAERYPNIDQIDVLNENIYKNSWDGKEHAAGSPYFRAGLGGEGSTGYDWMIWLFEKAREYFPNSKLVINDFELETNSAARKEMLNAIKVLRDRGLVDGFGTQAHCFNVDNVTASSLKSAIDNMASSGLPVYVTELDMRGGVESEDNEDEQLKSYSTVFPVFWEHPAVAGVTMWGYVAGTTWFTGTGVMNSDGTDKKALTWLKDYIAGRPAKCDAYCTSGECPVSVSVAPNDGALIVSVSPNPSSEKLLVESPAVIRSVYVYDQMGKKCLQVKADSFSVEIDVSELPSGVYSLVVSSGDSTDSRRIVVHN